MDLSTVQDCFKIFKGEMLNKFNIKLDETIDEDSIDRINHSTQILFMKYIISSGGNIKQNSVPCIIYKHLNSLIKQYYETVECYKVKDKLNNIEHKLDIVEDYIDHNKYNEVNDNKLSESMNKKYWFF
jgi:hypothetical protein